MLSCLVIWLKTSVQARKQEETDVIGLLIVIGQINISECSLDLINQSFKYSVHKKEFVFRIALENK